MRIHFKSGRSIVVREDFETVMNQVREASEAHDGTIFLKLTEAPHSSLPKERREVWANVAHIETFTPVEATSVAS